MRLIPRATMWARNPVGAFGHPDLLVAGRRFEVSGPVRRLAVPDDGMMRFWATAVFALGLAWWQGNLRTAFRSRHVGLQIARGALLVADIWMYVLALSTVALAAVQSITLVYPLLVTLFAIPLLGEKVGIFRIVAVLVGFCGALVIVRPGGVPLDWGVAFAVVGRALPYALYIVLTRKVSADDSPTTSMVYNGVVGLVISTAVGVFHWEWLDLNSFLLIGYIMITGVAAHGMMILALSMAPASVLQPFNYTSLPWALLISALIFHEPLDAISLIGAAVIVGAGAGGDGARTDQEDYRRRRTHAARKRIAAIASAIAPIGATEKSRRAGISTSNWVKTYWTARAGRRPIASSTRARRSSTIAQTISGLSIVAPGS